MTDTAQRLGLLSLISSRACTPCAGWSTTPSLLVMLAIITVHMSVYLLQGRCNNRRPGALYALYDCSTRQVCFKATSCVGDTTEGASGPKGGTDIAGYECPGVACGCASRIQADAQCVMFNDAPGGDWLFLTNPCNTSSARKDDITQGYSPRPSDGRISGWEYCIDADPNTVYVVQAHFNARTPDASKPGGFDNNTVDNQFPNSAPQLIKFKTPACKQH